MTNLDEVHDGHGDDDDGCAEETEQRDGDESNVRGECVPNQSVNYETYQRRLWTNHSDHCWCIIRVLQYYTKFTILQFLPSLNS